MALRVTKRRLSDRSLHARAWLGRLFRSECQAPASHVARQASAGRDHGPIFQHLITQFALDRKAEFDPPLILPIVFRLHVDRFPPPDSQSTESTCLPALDS